MNQEVAVKDNTGHHLGGLSDRQLRVVVFAGLTAFLVLAAYEFYLAVEMSQDLQAMTKQLQALSPNVQRNMDSMAANMQTMTASTSYMAQATGQMQADFWSLNRNVSPPFSVLTRMLPWAQEPQPYAGPEAPLPPPGVPNYGSDGPRYYPNDGTYSPGAIR